MMGSREASGSPAEPPRTAGDAPWTAVALRTPGEASLQQSGALPKVLDVSSPLSPYARVAVVALLESGEGWLMVRLPDRLAPIYTGREAPAEGLWAPPGGRLEEGEGLEDALHREMREELGIELETAGPCFAYLTFHKGERLLAVSMACRLPGGGPAGLRLDAAEAADARWVDVQRWLDLSRRGLTPWKDQDIVRATHLARQAWQAAVPGRRPA